MENDDPTAEAISNYFGEAGIDAADIVPWNVYPWYINRAPKAAELAEGLAPLRSVIEQMPHLKVIMLHGGTARTAWKNFCRAYPAVSDGPLHVIQTYHTSRQAFWHRDPDVRAVREQHIRDAFRQASSFLQDQA